jgi:hypothetical protein
MTLRPLRAAISAAASSHASCRRLAITTSAPAKA